MKAAVFEQFRGPVEVRTVPDPSPADDAAVIAVRACGICRSDWHGWMGHDSDVQLPHVPGHELAGEIVAVGKHVRNYRAGERVTVPFCCGCGRCRQCQQGQQHICDSYTQPGFTQWGAFADLVEIRHADVNLVTLPEEMGFMTAAGLGCRFATAFRAVVFQGQAAAGDWMTVHGCGGVGLSAIQIGRALGLQVIAVDVQDERLQLAQECGALHTLNAVKTPDIPAAVHDLSRGGTQLSLDALGSRATCADSILSLAKRGRHVQVGLMLGEEADPPIPMSAVIGRELELLGSHGMQAHEYPRMLQMISAGMLNPDQLITDSVSLEEGAALLMRMSQFPGRGVTVIDLNR